MKLSRALVNLAAVFALVSGSALAAHKLRETGKPVTVAKSDLEVTPSIDWNRLSGRIGKRTERWTLDGPQLNEVTFFGGVRDGEPLVKERSKKRDPLPKFTSSTLLVEVPELLEGTYRTHKKFARYETKKVEPTTFLGNEAVYFEFEFADDDGLTRKGEATATIIEGELYMVVFEAPRLHYFGKTIELFRALVSTAQLS
jgi:hypothetical protein